MATDLNKLFSTLETLKGSSGGASSASAGYTPYLEAPQAPKPETAGLFGQIAQGGINAVGGLLRAVTSIGRVSTNMANDILPYANRAFDIGKDGITQDELGSYLGTLWNGTWAGLGGAAKGLAYSFATPGEESAQFLQNLFGGEKPIEAGYDLFQKQDYIKATENLPWLKETRSEEVVGELPNFIPFDIPFMGIEAGKGMPITKAGLYSFGWDVATDPFSFMTLGLGGAAKGAAKAVGTIKTGKGLKAEAAKAGREVSAEEISTVVPPVLYKSAPSKSVPYNTIDTNPLIYIGKEMGRGFMDAHRATASRLRARSEVRAARRELAKETATQIAARINDPDFSFSNSIQDAVAVVTKKLQKAAAETPLPKEEVERLIGLQLGRLESQIPELIAKAEAKGFSNLAELRARAEAEGVTVAKQIESELMDDTARKFVGTSPAITRTTEAKYDAGQIEEFANLVRSAADAPDGGDIATAWDAFRQNADGYTVEQALKRLVSPLGSRKAKGTAARIDYEEREMMKRLAAIQKEKSGAGSEALSKAGKLGVVDKKALTESPAAIRKALLGTFDTKEALADLLKNASNVTGEQLSTALRAVQGGMRIAGERLQYMGLSGQTRPTAEFQFITSLRDKKYNPHTLELGSKSLNEFAVTAEGRAGGVATLSEVTRLTMKATGRWYPDRLGELLRKAGIKDRDLLSGDAATNAQDFIEIAMFRSFEAKTAEARGKILRAKYEQFGLDELVKKGFELRTSDVHLTEISKRAAALGRNSFKLSDDEIREMIELAAEAKQGQIDSIAKLKELGLNPHTEAGRVRAQVLGAREVAAQARAQAQTRTGFAPTKELEEIKKLKKVVNVVRDLSKGDNALSGAALADKFTEAFFKALPKTTTSKEIIKLGGELRDVIKNQEGLDAQNVRQPFLARLNNMVVTAERGYSRSSVAGFDFAFTDEAGKYVQGAVANSMAWLYAGSRGANSIDGGYFARYVEESLLGGRTDLPEGGLAAVRTHEARVEILNSVAQNWGGEGITMGSLQDALRQAKNHSGKGLSPAELKKFKGIVEATFKRFEDATLQDIKRTAIDRILFEEKMEYKVGWITRLSEEEQKIARQALANKVIEVSPELAKSAGIKTNKLAYKNIAEYLPGGKRVEMTEKNPALAQIADQVARQANAAARDAVETSRALTKLYEILPAWATKEELLKLASLGNMARATGALQSSTMMANMIVRTEAVAKLADKNLAISKKVDKKTASELNSERAFFDGIIKRLVGKFTKEGYKSVKEDLTGKSLDEIIAMDNPIAFLQWARNYNPIDSNGSEEWARAMQHMLNLETVGKGRAYRNAKELLQSYRKGVEGIKPATPEEVIETIASLGGDVPAGRKAQGYLNRKGLPQRRTILKLIDEAEPILDKSEIERAKGATWIKEVNLAGKDEVQEAIDSIPDIMMTPQKAYEHLTGLVAELEATNLGWIPTLAMQSVGDSVRQFFIHRADFFEKTVRDSLGRSVDQYLIPGKKRSSFIKRSWEDLTNYTGFKTMVSTIRDMAPNAKRGKLTEDEWVAKMTRLTMSVRDSYLLARGIVPVHTINLTTGEAIPNGLASALGKSGKEVDELNLTAVALTENDIMDLLPQQDVVELFFSGRVQSLPPTSVLPAARLLVSAMESLPPGAYFNEEQIAVLQKHMFETMQIGARAASTSEFAKISWVDLAPEEATNAMRIMVERLLDPDTATRLYEKHLSNATYASGILRYNAGQMSERIMSTWTQVAKSPIASSSDRIQATLEAMAELNEILKISDAGTEAERVMAVLDAQALMAKEVDVDSLFDIATANKIAKAGRVMGSEEAKISKLQQSLRQKRSQDEVNSALLEGMEAREPLLAQMYAEKIATLEKNGYKPDIDEQHLLFNDIITDQGIIPWYLNFTNTGLRAFSFDYRKENVAPYLGGAERIAIEGPTEYTNLAVTLAVKWGKVTEQTGKNYPEMAFKILQQIDDKSLPQAILASDTILKLTSRQFRETVDPNDIGALKEATDQIEFFKNLRDKDGNLLMPDDDPMLVQAISDLWSFGGHFFGKQGKLVRSGVPASWLNINLRQIGSTKVKEALKENADGSVSYTMVSDGYGFNPNTTKPEEMANQWRDWDVSNPFEVMSTLNSAIARSEKVMHQAVSLQKMLGTKASDFAKQGETAAETAARAKAEGLVKLPKVDNLNQRGRELLYFMDSEYYYPSGIASQIVRASNDMGAPYDPLGAVGDFAKKFDEIQNFAKRSMTIFRLGNFIMNFNGALWTNLMGGVTSPVAYYRSGLLLQNLSPNMRDLPVNMSKMEKEIVKYHAKRAEEGLTVRPENDPVTNKESMSLVVKGQAGNYKFSDLARIYRAIGGETPVASSRNLDLLGEYSNSDFLSKRSGSGMLREGQRLYEKISLGIGRLAAKRDDFTRAAMWLDELAKGNWTSLEAGAKAALKKVDRYHPQVQDLSRFNAKVTRQFIMFFTWQAKTLGWIVNDILDKPGAITGLLRAQYALQTQEGNQPEYFGSFDPKGVMLREYQQGNMNPLTGGLGYSFSAANPVTDLLGSNGWLSQINNKTYESPTTNLMTSTMGTMQQFLYSSSPLFVNFAIAWAAGRTAGGQDLLRSGSFNDESLSILSEEIAGQLGLTLPHAALAMAFPEQISRRSWKDETLGSEKERDTLRYLFNWLTGTRAQEYLTYEQQQKAASEIKSTLGRILKDRIE